ncbi:unnamed protein product, partial [Ixodes pacificus]
YVHLYRRTSSQLPQPLFDEAIYRLFGFRCVAVQLSRRSHGALRKRGRAAVLLPGDAIERNHRDELPLNHVHALRSHQHGKTSENRPPPLRGT